MVERYVEYHFTQVLFEDVFRQSGLGVMITKHRVQSRIPFLWRIAPIEHIGCLFMIFAEFEAGDGVIYALSEHRVAEVDSRPVDYRMHLFDKPLAEQYFRYRING